MKQFRKDVIEFLERNNFKLSFIDKTKNVEIFFNGFDKVDVFKNKVIVNKKQFGINKDTTSSLLSFMLMTGVLKVENFTI